MEKAEVISRIESALAERSWSLRDLARAVGSSSAFSDEFSALSSISRILSGEIKRPSMDAIGAICTALGLDLTIAETPAEYGSGIPVIAFGSAGKGTAFTDQGYPVGAGMYYVERPGYLSDPNAFAVEVDGDSMVPRYDPGMVLYVDTTKAPVNGEFAVVGLITGEKYVKRWFQRDGSVTLESMNKAYKPVKIRRDKVAFCYKIVGTRER